MTAYNFQGLLVDVKGYNWHMSALPLAAVLNTSLDAAHTGIDVGALVEDGGSGYIDNAQNNSTKVLGVANETRAEGDTRPLQYTWAGVVRVMTNNSAIVVGSPLKASTDAKVALCLTYTNANHALGFGKALEANGSADGTIIMAYIFMSH